MTQLNNFLFALLLFSISCKSQTASAIKDDDKIEDAKWYFYAYSNDLVGYAKNETEPINPLEFDLNCIKKTNISNDTTNIYFIAFYKDSTNRCFFSPYDIVGVKMIHNKLYVPIYRHIVFDGVINDSIMNQSMAKKEKELVTSIKKMQKKETWLYKEAKLRGLIE